MKNIALLALALIVAGGTAEIVKTGLTAEARQAAGDRQIDNSAAFRDGTYHGKLAAEQGNAPHVAVGRWSTNAERSLFASGYKKGYIDNSKLNFAVSAELSGGAAFRDGLYLGKLDSELGSPRHVAAARWSNAADRAAFADGYTRAYEDVFSANAEQRKVMRQALLVH